MGECPYNEGRCLLIVREEKTCCRPGKEDDCAIRRYFEREVEAVAGPLRVSLAGAQAELAKANVYTDQQDIALHAALQDLDAMGEELARERAGFAEARLAGNEAIEREHQRRHRAEDRELREQARRVEAEGRYNRMHDLYHRLEDLALRVVKASLGKAELPNPDNPEESFAQIGKELDAIEEGVDPASLERDIATIRRRLEEADGRLAALAWAEDTFPQQSCYDCIGPCHVRDCHAPAHPETPHD